MHSKLISIILLAISSVILTGCGSVDSELVTRPSATAPYSNQEENLITLGQKLWSDTSLSSNGAVSCNTCHVGNAGFKDTFKNPYPHYVQMAKAKSGLESITAEQMVQFCMVVPMKTDPLPWNSKTLAALTAYTEKLRADFASAN